MQGDAGRQGLEASLDELWAARRLAGDAAVRLGVLVGLAVVLMAAPAPWLAGGLALLLLLAAVRSGAGWAVVGLAAGAALVAVVLNAFTEPGPALLRLGPLRVTGVGLRVGGARALRLAGLVALGRLAVGWLDAWALAELGESRRGGGTGGGSQLAWSLGLALRLLPALREEAARLRLAGRIRPPAAQAPLAAARLVGRVAGLAALFLPLLAGALRRSEEVARTLDARCFGTGPRSCRRTPAPRGARLLALLLIGLAAGLLILVPGGGG